ncbi:Anaphase-promoting complex subunit 2 [Cichlidogyrus casuarinus]|uniref:Anaphase-promoting complex subunit 2 n=1 Tax=Cichlidogyrus casuarinus TaxID=1844966 RepID=A0ABD2PZJ2_9PLAT
MTDLLCLVSDLCDFQKQHHEELDTNSFLSEPSFTRFTELLNDLFKKYANFDTQSMLDTLISVFGIEIVKLFLSQSLILSLESSESCIFAVDLNLVTTLYLSNKYSIKDFESCFENALDLVLKKHIAQSCENASFNDRLLPELLDYFQKHVIEGWLNSKFSSLPVFENLKKLITSRVVYRNFYEFRESDLFSIIIDYPDSKPALLDIKDCLNAIPIRNELIEHLTHEVQSRLLNPGVATEDILLGYECLVPSLNIIDPSGMTCVAVCKPVAGCLRSRNDAIRCIVEHILESDLSEGAKDACEASSHLRSSIVSFENHDEDNEDYLIAEDPALEEIVMFKDKILKPEVQVIREYYSNWKPAPIESALFGKISRTQTSVFNTLLNIYDSKKNFIENYVQLLSDHLLRTLSFDITNEVKQLELLKLRFGETDLHQCDVMLKDIRNSKRITALITGEETDVSSKERALCFVNRRNPFKFGAYVLSAQYWPRIEEVPWTIPSTLMEPLKCFQKDFELVLGNRNLNWLHKVGKVSVELDLPEGRSWKLDLEPIQAACIYLFTQQAKWSLRELMQELNCTQPSVIKKALKIFISNEIIRRIAPAAAEGHESFELSISQTPPFQSTAVNNSFYVAKPTSQALHGGFNLGQESWSSSEDEGGTCKEARASGAMEFLGLDDDEDLEEAMENRRKQEEANELIWTYLKSMLTNLGGLSFDRIKSMLSLFCEGSDVKCSDQNLKDILSAKLYSGLLSIDSSGVYRLIQTKK